MDLVWNVSTPKEVQLNELGLKFSDEVGPYNEAHSQHGSYSLINLHMSSTLRLRYNNETF